MSGAAVEMKFVDGESFSAGRCRVFPLAFEVILRCPVRPMVVIQDAVGKRTIKTSVLSWHLAHGCLHSNGNGLNNSAASPFGLSSSEGSPEGKGSAYGSATRSSTEVGACNVQSNVLQCSQVGGQVVRPAPLGSGVVVISPHSTSSEKGAGTMEITATYLKTVRGYARFRVGGRKGGMIVFSSALFAGEPPASLTLEGPFTDAPVADEQPLDEEKAMKAAAKAEAQQAKAAKAAEKAAERVAKAQAAAVKAQERAAAAIAKASGAVASEGSSAASDSGDQPNL